MKRELPRAIVLACCEALEERRRRGGNWPPGGRPKCFDAVRDFFSWDENEVGGWFHAAEQAVRAAAVALVAVELSGMPEEP